MKKILLVLSGLMSIVALMAFNSQGGGGGHETMDSSGAPSGRCGDPASGNKTCNISGCHTGATVGSITGVITSDIPTSGYIAGSTYTVTANFVRAGHTKLGFEISPQNSAGTLLGTMAILSSQTKLVGSNKYITHTSTGTSGSGSKTWAFKWTAPSTGSGPVTFYGAFNATNSNGSTSGDSVFTSTMAVTENTTAVYNFEASNFSLSTFPNPTHNNLNVNFTLPEASLVEMDLIDINGNKAGNLSSKAEMNGEISRCFDISSYNKGIYFIRIHVNGNYTLQRIVKL